MSNNYTVFHLHTELSMLDSTTKYKTYVDKAVELGQKAICFTEHGNVYNWIDKKIYCDKNNIKYMHGVEIYLTRSFDENVRDNFHTILIAKNKDGFRELNNLIDLSTQESHFYYKNRISFEEFLAISDNIIKISACLASPLARLEAIDPVYKRLAKHYDYYEVQPHVNSDEQKSYNQFLLELSIKYNKPLIAGTDTHSIDKYNSECRAILQKSKGIMYSDEDYYDLTYKSYEEVVDMFKRQGSLNEEVFMQAIENTNVMAESVDAFDLDFSFKYPILYGSEQEDINVYKKRIVAMFSDKVNRGVIKKENVVTYKKAIKEEVRVLTKIGMMGFMLFMSEMLVWARENNIPYGYCRGSVGGSRVAYVTDIIDLDPEEWGTFFSRFANESRVEIGDIDVDFAPSQRELVYNYIIERFGQDKSAFILAIGTLAEKGAIDEIFRAFHRDWLKEQQKGVDETTSPYHSDKAMAVKSEYENNPLKVRERYPQVFYYFDGIVGTAVSQSMHPAGMVASPVTLTDNYGTFWNNGNRILSINMEEIHEVSLVKYDILGLKNVEIIKDCREMAGLKYPLSYELDWDDEDVWQDMIKSPVGIFQFEGDFAFSLLKRYVPIKINDMSMINASLRPSGESYRDRLVSREINKNPSKEIDDLLADNNGFLIFQEDTIEFLQDMCGLSGSEADNIRRAIGRKDEERLAKAMPSILEGYCRVSSQPREIAEQEALEFLKIIEDSSRYQFGKNHSTGYSMIGYTCAYERYHRPLEFVASYLNNANNQDDIRDGTILAELKGIKISPIKFRYSTAKYSIDRATNSIYKGMASIKFLNVQIADELYALRNNIYNSFTDLLLDIKAYTGVDSRQLKILTTLGFFSEFGKNKKLLNVIKAFDEVASRKQLKIADLGNLMIPQDIIYKHAKSVTEKMIKDFDGVAIVQEYEMVAEDESMNIKERIDFELEHLGYVDFKYERASKNIYYVSEFKVYKDKSKPYVSLYQVKTGETIKAKISQQEVFISAPFSKGNILVVNKMTQRPKSKLENGKWVKTSELENILTEYQVF